GRSALGEWMEGLAGPHGPVSFWSAYMHLYQHVMPEHKIYDSPTAIVRHGAHGSQRFSRITTTINLQCLLENQLNKTPLHKDSENSFTARRTSIQTAL
ncbi:hypothetical protein, partial [Pseudomonas poae]|uniref:hypothetical protein n=1 Tax=Pseudomonas poae TaxID=200451 RepID=UPI001F3F5B58